MDYFDLNDGNRIPEIGFGTYPLKGRNGAFAISTAINNGYRMIDSACRYENEGTVGAAIRMSGHPRGGLFITSKLPGRHHHYREAITQIQESLFTAGLDYFDLYLIHWPNPLEDHYVEAWQALIDAQKFGLVRSIGVSNFEPEHIDRLIAETGVTPAVNQVELHPYWSSQAVRKYNADHQILTQAWSPLMRAGAAFKEPIIQQLAQKYGKSPAQIILRWEIQLRVVPIPKASQSAHQLSNIDIFDFVLSPEEVKAISALDKKDGRNPKYDPHSHQEF